MIRLLLDTHGLFTFSKEVSASLRILKQAWAYVSLCLKRPIDIIQELDASQCELRTHKLSKIEALPSGHPFFFYFH